MMTGRTAGSHQRKRAGQLITRLRRVLHGRFLASVALLALFFFNWATLEPWNLAHAENTPPGRGTLLPKTPQAPNRASAKFSQALQRLKDKIRQHERQEQLGKSTDLTAVVDSIDADYRIIEDIDPAVQAEFETIEARIRAAGLPQEILDRHNKAVADYTHNCETLLAHLRTLKQHKQALHQAHRAGKQAEILGKQGELERDLQALHEFVQKNVPDPKHTPLDPNKLPFRAAQPTDRKPRLKAEEFAEVRPPIQLAFNGDLSVLQLAQANGDLPTPADLAETSEIQFTDEIQDLANQLENNPVKIYNWVRNHLDFVPTYGSIQGAQACLRSKECNDMDTASLLIALLRVAGIAARYVVGTIEIPIDKAMNWAGGFSNAEATLRFIARSGTPVIGLTSGDEIIDVRLEHVWVEAYIDYIPSRGVVHREGDSWVPLDASFKEFVFTDGIALDDISLDGQALFDQLLATADVDETAESVTNINTALFEEETQEIQTQLITEIDALPDPTFKDIFGDTIITVQDFSILPASLPYTLIVRASAFAAVPDALRHHLTFEVFSNAGFGSSLDPSFLDGALTFAASLPELADKKVTLSQTPPAERVA